MDLTTIGLAQLGPPGILAIIVLFIVFGRLVPKSTLDREERKATEVLLAARQEAAYWRETCTVQFAAHLERERAQDDALREAAVTWRTIMQEVPPSDRRRPRERGGGSGALVAQDEA